MKVEGGDPVRVTGVGYQPDPKMFQMQLGEPQTVRAMNTVRTTLMTKEEMQRMLGLVMYNNTGMAYKLARIAARMYVGLTFNGEA